MTRRAASLTGALMARKGAAGPSHLEFDEAPEPAEEKPGPRLVSPAPRPEKSKKEKKRKREAKSDASKRRFTLRLSEDQHLRMRLASVHLHMSAQQMVMTALDQYLARTAPEIRSGGCACMAGEDGDSSAKPSTSKVKA